MKTIVIISGYSFIDIAGWKQFPAYKAPVRVIIVRDSITEIVTDEKALESYLKTADLGKHYLIQE